MTSALRASLALACLAALQAQAGVQEGINAIAKRDFAEARRQFEASSSDPEALYQLGQMAFFGIGEPRNEARAVELYSRAWEAGHQQAGLALSSALVTGRGVQHDEARGGAIIRKLAEAGLPRAQYLYGWALEFGRYGSTKDEAAAAEWFRRAMDAGNVDGLVSYANLLSLGKGVPKDGAKAVQLLKSEVARDQPAAIVMYGRMLRFGQGVEKDEPEAFKQFKRAADLGSPAGQYEVGAAHLFGRGVARDPAEAARWIDAAARNGEILAQRMYGDMFRTGTGVPVSMIQAFKWFTIAYNTSGGNSTAANQSRATLATSMTTAQIEEANRQAAAYRMESNVRPGSTKPPELARGDRVGIGGKTLYTPLPDGYVNAWEIAERTRRSRPNLDPYSVDTLLVAMNRQDIDRIKMGLRVDDLRVLEFVKYGGDDTVDVSAQLFADMRKQVREAVQARGKAAAAPGFSERLVRDDDRAMLLLQARSPTGDSTGASIGIGLLRLNGRAAYIRVLGAAGTAEGQGNTAALMQDWAAILLNAN